MPNYTKYQYVHEFLLAENPLQGATIQGGWDTNAAMGSFVLRSNPGRFTSMFSLQSAVIAMRRAGAAAEFLSEASWWNAEVGPVHPQNGILTTTMAPNQFSEPHLRK